MNERAIILILEKMAAFFKRMQLMCLEELGEKMEDGKYSPASLENKQTNISFPHFPKPYSSGPSSQTPRSSSPSSSDSGFSRSSSSSFSDSDSSSPLRPSNQISKKGALTLNSHKPRQPKSSFLLYYISKKDSYSRQLSQDSSHYKLTQMASEEWKKMSAKQKQPYEAKALELREEYYRDLQKYKLEYPEEFQNRASLKVKKSKTEQKSRKSRAKIYLKEQTNRPKQPVSSFLLFYQDLKKNFLHDSGKQLTAKIMAREASQKWANMTPEEKKPFEMRSKVDRERYYEEMRKYQQDHAAELAEIKKNRRNRYTLQHKLNMKMKQLKEKKDND